MLVLDFRSLQITVCDCASLPQQLVANGLFPTAPKQPRMAISVDLLDLYKALFERSCDAVQAITSALCTFYERRGFCLLDDKVNTHFLACLKSS
ncbi:hypothetical protein FIBSPDRAFT_758769 [Athelia psychrophila]|uniref:CxC1-like cysteine cluster associated with KDZ transposases domain-containing protein n=1 Tax=Athelia psychrophila TaxID=1759441 RepID=A0A165Z1J9_9AGAM|nr:hypothetical protein FIBSPDRAFT_758769 [Fibularhizoctonia sp. CBS 109695]